MAAPSFLPYGRQLIDEDDIAAVAEALRADYLTTGPTVEPSSSAFAEQRRRRARGRLQQRHRGAASCRHGARPQARRLAGRAVAHVPRHRQLPRATSAPRCSFADVDPDTGLLTGATLDGGAARAAGARPRSVRSRCISPGGSRRHGRPRAVARPTALRDRRGCLPCARHDLRRRQRPRAGRRRPLRPLATFSFHPVKTIAIGEGGMITTNDAALAERMRVAPQPRHDRASRSTCATAMPLRRRRHAAPWYYEMDEFGFNYRLTDMLCALGLSQLKKLDRFAARRRAARRRAIDELPGAAAPLLRLAPSAGRLRAGLASLCGPHRLRAVPGVTRGAGHGGAARARHRHAGALHSRPPAALLSRPLRRTALPGADAY